MTPEERDLISGLFERLKGAETGQKDREADDLITQLALVQEHALTNAQTRISRLEAELAEAKRAQPQQGGGGTSFLGGLIGRGPWGAPEASPQPPPAAAPTQGRASGPAPGTTAPWSGSVPPTAPSPGGGFLHQALSTAAGVAGGALLFDGIRSLFWHNPGPFGPALGASWGGGSGWAQPAGVNETIVNNYYGDAGSSDPGQSDPSADPNAGVVDTGYSPDDSGQLDDQGGIQDADFSDNGGDFDSGGDFGGGDDTSFT